MAYSKTTLQYQAKVTVTEILAANAGSLSDKTVKHSAYDSAQTFDADSDVPVTKVAAFEADLAAGSGSIDLTALTGTNGATVDGTGLKVQAIKLIAKADNANPLTIAVGAANGYELLGANFEVALSAGQEVTIFGNEAAPEIGGAAKAFDLTGTGEQGLYVIVVMG